MAIFTIVDRKKDIIKTSGFLVFPAEVEEVLRNFPQVAEAAVIGVPDAERGELVKAMVVPQAGAKIHLGSLEAHCAKHLGKQKRPKQIEIVPELPKNFLGKIQRRACVKVRLSNLSTGLSGKAEPPPPVPCRAWRRCGTTSWPLGRSTRRDAGPRLSRTAR